MTKMRRARWYGTLALLTAAIVFVVDLRIPTGVAAGVAYVAVVWLGCAANSSRMIWSAAVVTSLLAFFGAIASGPGADPWIQIVNCLLALIVIWTTAFSCSEFLKSLEGRKHQLEAAKRDAAALSEMHIAEARRRRVLANVLEDLRLERQKLRAEIEERRRLADIVDSTDDAVIGQTLEGRITSWNRGAERLYGYSKQEMIGNSISWLVPADRSEEVSGILDRLRRGQSIDHYATVGICKNGAPVYVSLTISPIKDSTGRARAASVIARDVSQERHLERTLRDLNAQLEQRAAEAEKQRAEAVRLAEAAQLAQQRAEDAEQLVTQVTTQLALPPRDFDVRSKVFSLKAFTLSDMMVCGAAIRSMARGPADSRDLSRQIVRFLYEQFLDDQGESEFALVRLFETTTVHMLESDLLSVAREAAPQLQADSHCLVLRASIGDVSEWRGTTQAGPYRVVPLVNDLARRQVPVIARILEQMGLVEHGAEHDFRGGRPGATDHGLLHLTSAENSPHSQLVRRMGVRSIIGFGERLRGDRVFVVIGFSKARISDDVASRFSHLSHSASLALLPHLDGNPRPIAQLRAFDRLLANHERIVAEQEARLHQAMADLKRRNAELDEFAYVASHDLRSPLQGVRNLAQWIREDNEDVLGSKSKRHLDQMLQRVERLERLLSDLLHYSRAGRHRGNLEQVDVESLIQQTADVLGISKGFKVVTTGPMPKFRTFKVPLEQVFRNLIANAVQHHDRTEGIINVSCSERGTVYEFSVADDGPGIPSKFHGQVFTMFETLKPRDEVEGSGMGLALVKRIVEGFGGDVSLESNGRGAAFRFTWPKTAPAW